MEKLNIAYTTYKELVEKYNLPVYYTIIVNGYSLYSSGNNYIYICEIYNPEDISDFETNFKETGTQVESHDDAVALVTVPYISSYSGYDIAQAQLIIDGKILELPIDSTEGYIEWTFDYLVEIQGMDGLVIGDGAAEGDYITMTIQHPIYGEIKRFANNLYMYKNELYSVICDRVSQMPSGLSMRLTYNAVDGNGRKIIARARLFK